MATEVKIIRSGQTLTYDSFDAALAAGLVNEDNIQIVQGKKDTISGFSNIDTVANLKWNVTGGTIYNCTDSASGGFIHSTRISTVDNVTFLSNKALGGQGGAIFHEGANNFTINNSKFILNSATTHGGAITFNYGKIITVNNSEFDRNYATSNGGAIKTNYGGTFSNMFFTGNTANNSAGALYIANSNSHETDIYGTTFSQNRATYYGGAVFVDSAVAKSINISGSTFTGNTSSQHGGAIYHNGTGEMVISTSTFEKNRALSYDGGALRLQGANIIHEISDSEFIGNTAGRHGGAIYLTGTTLNLSGVTFDGNKSYAANINSGAIYIEESTSCVSVTNSTFATSTDSIYNASKAGNLTFYGKNYINASIVGNAVTMAENSQIVFGNTVSGSMTIILFNNNNNIIFDNTATLSFAGKPNFNAAKISLTVTQNLLEKCADGFVIASGIGAEINTGKTITIENFGDVKIGQNFTVGTSAYEITSVAGTSNYNLVVSVFRKVVDDITGQTIDNICYGSLNNDGGNLKVTLTEDTYSGIVRAGSAEGTDGVVQTFVSNGSFVSTLYGGGLVSAEKTDLTISGAGVTVDRAVYGGICAKGDAVTLGESNLTIENGTFKHNIVGGSRVDVANNDNTAKTTTVKLTLNGGAFTKPGTNSDSGTAVYSAGYVVGNNSLSAAAEGFNHYEVETNNVFVKTDVTGAVYGGAYTCYNAIAYVENVTINVTSGSVTRVLGGGWAQSGGVSKVDNVTINVSDGVVGSIYAGGGNAENASTRVETAEINISDDADVKKIYMGGKYDASTVDSVVVTITGEADGEIDFITGRNGNGAKRTGTTELVVDLDTTDILTVNRLDCVDKLTIVDGSTLAIGDLNMTGKDDTVYGLAIEFKFEGEVSDNWTVLSGIALEDIADADFYLNGNEIAFENGVLGDGTYTLTEENNQIKLLLANN